MMAGWLWNHWFWITAAGFPVSQCLDLPQFYQRESNALRNPSPNQNSVSPPLTHSQQQHIGLGSLERWRLRKEERTSSFLERLLSKIKRFARVTLAGRAKPEKEDEEEEKGEEIIIMVEEEDRKAPGVRVGLKEKEEKVKMDLKEMEATTPPPSSSSTSPVWESRKLIGRGGWRQIGPSKGSWRGHLEENEGVSEEGVRSRSSEARGRSLELDTLSLRTQETEEEEGVVKNQGAVALGRAEGRVALRGEKESLVRREGRMVVERSTGVDLLQFTNFLIVTVGVAVFIIISSVLVGTVVCQHRRRQKAADNFPDDSSCSSCPSSLSNSTMVSYNSSGLRGIEGEMCEDLYSLDNDYFLSSLDISIQN